MSNSDRLVRMAYASTATFKPFDTNGGIDGHVAQILETARRENKKYNLVGALYYGNGYFFQCLEGTQSEIDRLYSKLLRDPRHKDLKILSTSAIDRIGFTSWEMKFATIDREIRSFLRNHNMIKFDPYKFDPIMSNKLVELLHDADEEAPAERIENAVIAIKKHEDERKSKKFQFLVINGLFMLFFTAIIYLFLNK